MAASVPAAPMAMRRWRGHGGSVVYAVSYHADDPVLSAQGFHSFDFLIRKKIAAHNVDTNLPGDIGPPCADCRH